ncbi:MAG: polysaccharide deacetylase family protein [Firmicutes bacterium]|nr:polysaccharide deacetylase family protein [Bacillota bacterium]
MKKMLPVFLIVIISLMFTSGWNFPPPGRVLLTFDDGPHPVYTPQVLQVLQNNGVKAVFFVVGSEIERYPDLLAEINRHGHLIGNHTYTHRDITSLTPGELREEINRTGQLITDITGQQPIYFRPPRGRIAAESLATIQQMNLVTVMWDAGLERRGVTDSAKLVNSLRKRIRHEPDPVLLLHDGDLSGRHDRTPTVKALPLLINELQARGYGFADPWEKIRLPELEG